MGDSVVPKISKLPFAAADALLVGAAVFVFWQAGRPLSFKEMALIAACAAAGAFASILPYVLEYRAVARLAEADHLARAVRKLEQVEALAAQVTAATNRWAHIQETSEATSRDAKAVADRMTAELKEFTEFMAKANDAEKSNLRLEVEKLRRGEGEWLQVLVRMLDHVFALHQGAARSKQPRVAEQISRFQHAICDAARRVGVAPFVAAPEEAFDPARHQWADGDGKPAEGAAIGETLATGYTFQGRIVRPALVRPRGAQPPAGENAPEEQPVEPQLPLGA